MTDLVTYRDGMPFLGSAVVAIGVFDGVHLGHQMLVRDAIDHARDRGSLAVVLTFDRDPDRVVMPEKAAPQLLELDDKVRLLGELGPDIVLVVPFDTTVAAMVPEAFISRVLLTSVAPTAVVVGHDFRFGARASGDVRTLTESGRVHGFAVRAHDLLELDGRPVTSTRIRAMLEQGDVRAAARLLGRPHFLTGRVERGRGAGHELGVPTANVMTHSWSALPADGVYAGRARVGETWHDCAVSVGLPPTFMGASDRLEVHLIDYSGPDLYGETLTVGFTHRIREQRRFSDHRALTAAIVADIDTIRELLRSGS
ncbi:MAG: riboflavin biosynthesis protein RibF [Actinobacteria bacterium]|nr:MAG: riboflavin biosynthesis protein RibF [Actinomycetota bacterium]